MEQLWDKLREQLRYPLMIGVENQLKFRLKGWFWSQLMSKLRVQLKNRLSD